MSKRTFHLAAPLIGIALAACAPEPAEDPAANALKSDASAATIQRTAAPAGARVFFISPADGDTLSNPVVVVFGIEGMSVAKAGDDQPLSGHHHLIIDAGLPELSLPVPANEHYKHFGDASTATTLTLEPGTHTLQLLLGDYLHVAHDPPLMSEVITITVE